MLATIARSPSRIAFLPAPQDDPKQRQPNISLAKRELEWIPTVGLLVLERTVAYFRQIVSNQD
jgi:UDP-glucuronate decarboxylase